MRLSTVPAAAPRRLLSRPEGRIEVVWAREGSTSVHVMSSLVAGASEELRELFVLSGPRKVLRFDVLRDSHGTYHVGALTRADDQVAVLAARYDGGRPIIGELASEPLVGARITVDGKFPYPQEEDYESLHVVARPAGTSLVLWTNGHSTHLGELDLAGQVSEEPLPGPGERAAVAVDGSDKTHVLSIGQNRCVHGGPHCDEGVSYLWKGDGAWSQTALDRAEEGIPELVVSGTEPPKAFVIDDYARIIDPSAPDVRAFVTTGRTLNWARPVRSSSGPALVGLSDAGTLHAVSLAGDLRSGTKVMPLVDLTTLDPESTNLDAIGVGEDIYVVTSTGGVTELRRLRALGKSEQAPEIGFTELLPRDVRLGAGEAFAGYQVLPHSGPYAGFYRVLDATCRVPISESLKVPFNPVLAPTRDSLRVFGSLTATTWGFEEYRFPPSGVSEPGENPPSNATRTWTIWAHCGELKVFSAAPVPVRSEILEFPRGAEWVGQDEGGVYALVSTEDGFSLYRLDWQRTPLSPEFVGSIEGGADPQTLVARRDPKGHLHVMYGLRSKNEVVLSVDGQEKARASADEGAFAFVMGAKDTPGWVVRRDSKLAYEWLSAQGVAERALADTNARALAATVTATGKLLVALEAAPSRAPVIASFGEGSEWSAVLGPRCYRGTLRTAKFLTPSFVALGCDYPPEDQ